MPSKITPIPCFHSFPSNFVWNSSVRSFRFENWRADSAVAIETGLSFKLNGRRIMSCFQRRAIEGRFFESDSKFKCRKYYMTKFSFSIIVILDSFRQSNFIQNENRLIERYGSSKPLPTKNRFLEFRIMLVFYQLLGKGDFMLRLLLQNQNFWGLSADPHHRKSDKPWE